MSGADVPRLALVRPDPLEELTRLLAGIPGAVIVGQSEPRFCLVCDGQRRVRSRWLTWRGFGEMACPHCARPPIGRHFIPLVFLPMRIDVPRQEAA